MLYKDTSIKFKYIMTCWFKTFDFYFIATEVLKLGHDKIKV